MSDSSFFLWSGCALTTGAKKPESADSETPIWNPKLNVCADVADVETGLGDGQLLEKGETSYCLRR